MRASAGPRAHLDTYPAILDRALAPPPPPAPEEPPARPGFIGRALGLFRAEDDIPPAPEPGPRALNDVDPDYRKWDIRAEQFVKTFRNWRAIDDAAHNDHVDRRWIDMADLVGEIEAIRRDARDPEAGPRRIELPDAGAFAAGDQRHDPGRLDMLMHAVTRPEDERDPDALVELARRNRAWPEEKVAAVLGDAASHDRSIEGKFLNRSVLKAPPGLDDGDALPRFRWTVRSEDEGFDYTGLVDA